jgi:hypothetical protein
MTEARTLSAEDEKLLMRGLAVQPFVAAAMAFLLFPGIDYTGILIHGAPAGEFLEAAFPFSVLVGVAASFVTGLLVYPGLRWLLKRGSLTKTTTLISGAVFGNVPCALIVAALAARHLSRGVTPTLRNTTYSGAGALRLVVFGTVIGVVSAAAFWWLSGRHLSGRRRA